MCGLLRPDPCARSLKIITLPLEPSWSRGVYHLYVIRHADREGLQAHLGYAKALELASTIRFRCTCRRRIEASDTGREISR